MHVTVWLRAARNDRLELQQAAPCAVPLAQNAEAKATGLVEYTSVTKCLSIKNRVSLTDTLFERKKRTEGVNKRKVAVVVGSRGSRKAKMATTHANICSS
jgi:hypothetical protein